MEYSIYLISNKPQYYPVIEQRLLPDFNLQYFDGSNVNSFSHLVNSCVAAAPAETVILMSDKVLPTKDNIKKTLELLDQGYGLVALYRFAFFGLRKELFRRIGCFDERFSSGGYEDDDYFIRLKEGNIGIYVTQEVQYEKRKSSWNYSINKKHFKSKWFRNKEPNLNRKQLFLNVDYFGRNIEEESYGYNLGEATNEVYLPYNQSYITSHKAQQYADLLKN